MQYYVVFKQKDQETFELVEFYDYFNDKDNSSIDWMCYSDFVTVPIRNMHGKKEKLPIYKISTVKEVIDIFNRFQNQGYGFEIKLKE